MPAKRRVVPRRDRRDRRGVRQYIQMRLGEQAHRETIRKELVALRRALTLQHERGALAIDPRALIPRFKARYLPKGRHLTQTEFMTVMRTLPPPRRLWMAVAVFTGARLSKVEGIR